MRNADARRVGGLLTAAVALLNVAVGKGFAGSDGRAQEGARPAASCPGVDFNQDAYAGLLARPVATGGALMGVGWAEPAEGLRSEPRNAPTPPEQQSGRGRWEPKTRTYIGPRPDRFPSLAPGQAFLCLRDDPGLVLINARTGGRIPPEALALKMLTLTDVGPGSPARPEGENRLRLRFVLAGCPDPVLWEGSGDLYDLPGLYPVAEDDTVRGLRARYVGRRVWGYAGGVGATAIPAEPYKLASFAFFNDARRGAAVVKRIMRLRNGRPFPLTMGSALGYAGMESAAFSTREPLIVVLERPTGARRPALTYSSFSASGYEALSNESAQEGDASKSRKSATKRAMDPEERMYSREVEVFAYYAVFADAWDFEREYSLISPEQAGRKWPSKLRRDVREGNVTKGMTSEMVAWVEGFPSEYGTKADFLKRPRKEWRYNNTPPFDYVVYFKNGRVSGWYHAQRLP